MWVVDAGGDELQRLQSDPELQPTARIPVGNDAQGISLGLQLAWVANTGDDTIDLQPCGGTHVRSTGEIGGLRIGRIEKKGRENRRVNLHFAEG